MHNENGTTPSSESPELSSNRFSGRNSNNEYFISCSARDNTNEPCLKVTKCVLRSFKNEYQRTRGQQCWNMEVQVALWVNIALCTDLGSFVGSVFIISSRIWAKTSSPKAAQKDWSTPQTCRLCVYGFEKNVSLWNCGLPSSLSSSSVCTPSSREGVQGEQVCTKWGERKRGRVSERQRGLADNKKQNYSSKPYNYATILHRQWKWLITNPTMIN